jgi:two-component system OmpR family sensor kinase
MSRLPIRLRLTLAFTAVAGMLLAAAGWFLELRLSEDLSQALDQSLRQRSQDLAVLVRDGVEPLDLESSGLIERGESFAQVVDSRGAVLAGSSSLRGRALLAPQELALAREGALFLDRPSVPGLDEPARLLADPVSSRDGQVVLVVGSTQGNRLETLATLRTELLVGGPVLLLAASLGGYLLSGAALRPVDLMRRRAQAITAHEPGRRLPLPAARDELARLGMTLNDLLTRLEAALERERKFVADASHELRTPLSLLRTELELALRHPRSAMELRRAIESAAEETRRLSRLAEDLLLMAAVDQGRLPVRLRALSVDELLHRSATHFEVQLAAQGRSLRIGSQALPALVGAAGPTLVGAAQPTLVGSARPTLVGPAGTAPGDVVGPTLVGDGLRLEQAVGNLIDNAVRHGAGDVSVFARWHRGSVELHVTDQGPGFAADYLPRAFERFSRPDAARTGGGTGLGLSIAYAIARAHGGIAHAANRADQGADLWLSLPLSSLPPT